VEIPVELAWRVLAYLGAALVLAATGAVAGQAGQPSAGTQTVPLTIDQGAALWLSLDKRLPAKHAGEPVEAHLTQPLYAFDRVVVPAGAKITGRVVSVETASWQKRGRAILAGDFTPLRHAQIEFDTLVLQGGTRVPLRTKVSEGLPETVHLEKASADSGKTRTRASEMTTRAKQEIQAKRQEAINAIRALTKVDRFERALKARAKALLPYHSQALPVGTRFSAELLAPLDFGTVTIPAQVFAKVGSPEIPPGTAHAWLTTPLSSASAKPGQAVEAVVSQPMFSADHQLWLPVGTRLDGVVTQVKPARRFDRNGTLRFNFRRIIPPSGLAQRVEGNLVAVDATSAAHIKLDEEGGAHATSPKSSYVLPVLDVALAMSTLGGRDQKDIRNNEPPDANNGDAVTGGIGFGLIGAVMSATNRYAARGFGFYGAAWGIYSRFIARGNDVVFPIGTPMEISLGSHGSPPGRPATASKFRPSTERRHDRRSRGTWHPASGPG
jgi:hypothetical protein